MKTQYILSEWGKVFIFLTICILIVSHAYSSNYGLQFDDSNDYVLVNNNPSLSFSSTLTVEAWIYPYYNGQSYMILAKEDTSNNRDFEFNTEGYVQMVVFSNSTQYQFARGGGFATSAWSHVAGVYDGSSIKVFVNGTIVASTAYNGPISNTASPLTLGNWLAGDRSFNGILDEVRIWNIARSQSDIQSTMNHELTGSEIGLVGYWKLNEGLGQFAGDSSGHSNTGQLGSTSLADIHDPIWVSVPAISNLTTAPNPPPYGLSIASFDSTQVSLNWFNTLSDISGFNIYRRTLSTPFQQINNFIVSTTTYTDYSISNGNYYVYSVRAVDTAGIESGDSNHVGISIDFHQPGMNGYSYTLSAATEIGYYTLPQFIPDVAVSGNFAYIANESEGLKVLDISSYANPQLSNIVNRSPSNVYNFGIVGVDVVGNYAYCANKGITDYGNAGLDIYDISSPENPIFISKYLDTNYPTNRVKVIGKYVYLTHDSYAYYSVVPGVQIIDVANPYSPQLVGGISIPGANSCNDVAVGGNYMLLANDTPALQIVDITTLSNLTSVGSFHISGGASGVDVQGNYVYLAALGNGLRVIDISNPGNPVEVGHYNTGTQTNKVKIVGKYAYVIDALQGLQILDISHPANPVELLDYTSPYGLNKFVLRGNYAFAVDGSTRFRIIKIGDPLPNVSVTLSGDTDLSTNTDSTGYYQFNNLSLGSYTDTPIFANYNFSPVNYVYSALSGNLKNQDFVASYSNWTNFMGNFTPGNEHLYWGFETPGNVSGQSSVTTLGTYLGHTGVLKLSFSTDTQGLKITSLTGFTTNWNNPWYRLRVNYSCDSPSTKETIMPVILTYPNSSSFTIQEVGAALTGNSLIQSGVWNTIDAYIYCQSSSGLLQLIAKNNGSTGAMYIDSIDLENMTPTAYSSPINLSVPHGDFDTVNDTTYWGFQTPMNATNGQPSVLWLSSLGQQTGILSLNFSNVTQGLKLTSKDLFSIPVNKNAVLSFKVRSNLITPSGINILGFLYAEKDANKQIWDVSGYGNFGNIPGNQWVTYNIPLTSSSQTTHRLQLVINNTNQSPENVFLDDIQLFYSNSVPTALQDIIEPELNK